MNSEENAASDSGQGHAKCVVRCPVDVRAAVLRFCVELDSYVPKLTKFGHGAETSHAVDAALSCSSLDRRRRVLRASEIKHVRRALTSNTHVLR